MTRLLAITAYVAAILAANLATAHYGMVPVGFGLTVTAGTYAAGAALLARDLVHATAGREFAIYAVLAGGALSSFVAPPQLAAASTIAFLGSELLDLGVYEAIRRRAGFIAGALISNVVAAPVDTVLFLAIAGFPLTTATIAGQFVGKVLWATLVPLAIVAVVTAARRRQLAA